MFVKENPDRKKKKLATAESVRESEPRKIKLKPERIIYGECNINSS